MITAVNIQKLQSLCCFSSVAGFAGTNRQILAHAVQVFHESSSCNYQCTTTTLTGPSMCGTYRGAPGGHRVSPQEADLEMFNRLHRASSAVSRLCPQPKRRKKAMVKTIKAMKDPAADARKGAVGWT